MIYAAAYHGESRERRHLDRVESTREMPPNGHGPWTVTWTAAPISKNYIAGLRGAPDSKMSLVNLTIDPEVTIGKYR